MAEQVQAALTYGRNEIVFMKHKLIILILLFCAAFFAKATTNEVGQVLIPANKPIAWAWDWKPEEPNYKFKLWDGTNLIVTFTTNEFLIIGTTNSINTYTATNSFSKGTNNLTLTVVGEIGGESQPSNILPIKSLGEPLPPSAPRKL